MSDACELAKKQYCCFAKDDVASRWKGMKGRNDFTTSRVIKCRLRATVSKNYAQLAGGAVPGVRAESSTCLQN